MTDTSIASAPRSRKPRPSPFAGGVLRETACPRCGGPAVRYSLQTHILSHACGWSLEISSRKHKWEIALAAGMGDSLTAYLAALPAGPAPEDGPKVISTKPAPDTHKVRILPSPDESPAAMIERKADQFYVNGGALKPAPGGILATSQERDNQTGAPVGGYLLSSRAGEWRCSCPATGFCAHLAGYHRHLTERLQDPDSALTPGQRAALTRTRDTLGRQAGMRPARGGVGLSYDRALDDLYGEGA